MKRLTLLIVLVLMTEFSMAMSGIGNINISGTPISNVGGKSKQKTKEQKKRPPKRKIATKKSALSYLDGLRSKFN